MSEAETLAKLSEDVATNAIPLQAIIVIATLAMFIVAVAAAGRAMASLTEARRLYADANRAVALAQRFMPEGGPGAGFRVNPRVARALAVKRKRPERRRTQVLI